MSFPVWRELKLSQNDSRICWCSKSYNVLSRLKGIETPTWGASSGAGPIDLQCPFPFEGNWNVANRVMSSRQSVILQCPFPFEGNWNKRSRSTKVVRASVAYNVLSRLKGIETAFLRACAHLLPSLLLTMSFPVWRELKPSSQICSNTFASLTMSFPVWRELKPWGHWIWRSVHKLTMSFPVWRELKLNFFNLPPC